MVNPWIEHVKKYAKEHNETYACAIPEASKTYTKNPKALNNKGKNDEIKKLESELKDAKNNIDSVDFSQNINKSLSGRRVAPGYIRDMKIYENKYNKAKQELENLTNKKYESLPTPEVKKKQQKLMEKQLKKQEAEDRDKYVNRDLKLDKVDLTPDKRIYKKTRGVL